MSNILSSFVAGNEDTSAGKSSTASSTQIAISPLREANQQFNLQQVQQFQQQPQGSFVAHSTLQTIITLVINLLRKNNEGIFRVLAKLSW